MKLLTPWHKTKRSKGNSNCVEVALVEPEKAG